MRILLISLMLSLVGCESMAAMSTPKKNPAISNTALSARAESHFWKGLHKGDYASISETENLLTAAYLENPNDPRLASYLGFLHIWKITERNRLQPVPSTIVNEIILAKKYFKDANKLNPSDARIQGFLADSMLVEGQIFNDQREEVRGYFGIQSAIHAWPQFNYFTGGYVMSTLPHDSDRFKEGMEWQWKTLDLCAGTKIDRHYPNFSPYMYRETQTGPNRACWNSWIAPHNFEGFFLNMGDMLVKQGYTQTAVTIYKNARLSKRYNTWPHKNLLEKRIQGAEKMSVHFVKPNSFLKIKRFFLILGMGALYVIKHFIRLYTQTYLRKYHGSTKKIFFFGHTTNTYHPIFFFGHAQSSHLLFI